MRTVRDLGWAVGAPARAILLAGIGLYRVTLSGWLGGQCRFHPSCSRYAEDAIRMHGAVKGTLLATRRILRCNPFGRGGLDPVPSSQPRPTSMYDSVTHVAGRAPRIGDTRAG